MSFRCDYCDEAQPNGVKPIKVVTQTRNVTYPRTKDDRIPTGTEIVKEVDLCVKCNASDNKSQRLVNKAHGYIGVERVQV